ncbi:hypothetical protein GGI07_000744 [Coemansia sp. Benny D115]|nr:hypothetical protein GGI07_000744 [Coemansia sp. Benny D115]
MKHFIQSSLPPIDVPATDIASFFFSTVGRHAEFNGQNKPARPLFIDPHTPDRSLTLHDLKHFCQSLAAGLHHRLHVRPGDVVAIVMPNSTYYPAVILAVLMAGATCTLANPAYTARELAHQLEDSKAVAIITVSALHAVVTDAIALLSFPLHAESHLLVADRENPRLCSIFDVATDQPFVQCQWTSTEANSTPAFIPYSSGTTGKPKGVILSHHNIIANILQAKAVHSQPDNPDEPRTSVAVLPMFHSFGLLFLCFLMPINQTATVIMPKFEMSEFLRLIKDYQVTETMLVPPIVNALAKMSKQSVYQDISSLRQIVVGAAPLSPETIQALETHMPQLQVLQGYGLTESSPAISLNPPGPSCQPKSAGRLLPMIDALILDDQGRAVGPDETGELCFRGPNMMLGYLNNPVETQRTIDSNGFLHTGDIGYIDSNQFVYITDRKKELIKFNGFQVAPAELEGILLQHPRVSDCAVIGVFDEKRQTEVPRAYLVFKHDQSSDVDYTADIVEWLNSQVAYYKQLRGGCRVVQSIPKSASGKILRRMLKTND